MSLRMKPPGRPVINRNHPDAQGLVLDLPFWERGGTTVEDVSGNGNDGTQYGSPTWDAEQFGPALFQDGLDDYGKILTPNISAFGAGSFTLEAIVKAPAGQTNSATILQYSFGTPTVWWLVQAASGTKLQLYIDGDTTAGLINITTSQTIFDGGWKHIVATVDQSVGIAKQYVDGAFAPTLSTSTFTPESITPVQFIFGHNGSRRFTGHYGCFRIWARALTPQEIAARYVNPNRHYLKRASGLLVAE